MRPLKLTLEAFGTFRQRTVIDFRVLGKTNFFLIHGRTGAGKTTLLDAICYALYGEASVAGRKGDMLRSSGVEPEADTYVELDFMLAGKYYRIHRSPNYERKSSHSANKMTMQKMSASLWELEKGKKNSIENGSMKVTSYIRDLLGFGAEEFRQVVLLPQGEFRRFLLADSNERQKILEMLFKTERFRQLEEHLKAKKKQLEEKAEKLISKRAGILTGTDAEDLTTYQSQTQACREQLANLESEKKQREAQVQALHQELSEAGVLASNWKNLKDAQDKLAELEQKAESVSQYRQLLAEAERAAKLEDVAQNCTQRVQELDQRRKEKLQAEEAQQLAQEHWQQASERQERAQAANKSLEEKQAEARRLDEGLKKLTSFQSLQDETTQAKHEAEQLRSQVQVLKKRATESETSLQKAHQEVQSASDTIAKEKALRLELDQAQKQRAERERRDKLITEREKQTQYSEALAQEVQAAKTKVAHAEHQVKILQDLFTEGQAAFLANHLLEGHPCPVCGALHHPQLAFSTQKIPSEANLKKAQDEAQRQRADFQHLATQLAQEKAKLIALEHSLQESQQNSVTVSLRTEEEIHQDLEAVQVAKEKLAGLQRNIQHLEQDIQEQKQQVESAEQRTRQAESHAAQMEGSLKEQRASLQDFISLDARAGQERLAGLQRNIHAIQQESEVAAEMFQQADKALAEAQAHVTSATHAVDEAHEAWERSQHAFQQRLQSSGFRDEDAWNKALAGKFQQKEFREKVQKRIEQYTNDYALYSEALHRAQQETQGTTEPDVQAIKEKYAQALQASQDIASVLGGVVKDLNLHEEKEQQLLKLEAEERELNEAYSIAGRLAEVATGTNAHRMRFQAYVLRSFLDDVVDMANARLEKMTHGQYHLERCDTPANKRKLSGLDLEVFDAATGYARPIATLSGGESFLAALSLALGLSDVVMNYAGGVNLEAIFIDEGFGTLDSETLDLAIKTLMELQAGGRLVGVISHVEELKERINARLLIEKGEAGSTAHFSV